jgi:hypothetical protein
MSKGSQCTASANRLPGFVAEIEKTTLAHAVFGGISLMKTRRIAALQAALLLIAVLANAASRDNAIHIKVLDSETRSVSLGGNDVPKNCDGVNFDAYCNNSKSTLLTNTLTVQVGNDPPFRIACTIDSRWSRCTPQAKGESFEARRVKHGVIVYYVDDKGKARSQLYTMVDNSKARPTVSVAAVVNQPAPGAAAYRQIEAVSAPATPASSVQEILPEKVRCNFSSTPSGAEITLDGRYMGSTPSEIGLSVGTHVVVFSTPGFAQWKRELTVVSGSELSVSAILLKAQQ